MSELDRLFHRLKGGAGSGNFGHAGRPGKRGGSSASGSHLISKASQNSLSYFNQISNISGVPLEDVVYISNNWNQGLMDNIKKEASDIFSINPSDYEKSQLSSIKQNDKIRKVVQATYQVTQDFLSENKVDKLKLYRGTEGVIKGRNIIESWAVSEDSTMMYGSNVKTKYVPAKNILSLQGIGFGGHNEVLVLNL